jgi:hypothetical protein
LAQRTVFLTAFFLVLFLPAFTQNSEIGHCFLSFATATHLMAAEPERLPDSSPKSRTVTTEAGELEVTRIDGYRILYNNDKGVPFVNVKVELSDSGAYESDQKRIMDNLKYTVAHSEAMESKDLIKLAYNGYSLFGLSRTTIDSGQTLGIFVLFAGQGVTVYFYFNNLRPAYRNFHSVEDYQRQRNQFLQEYTKHLTRCHPYETPSQATF